MEVTKARHRRAFITKYALSVQFVNIWKYAEKVR